MRLGITSGRDPLPVHSPLLKQSQLLALPPLSDMLKFGGLLHVHQVTIQLCFPERGALVLALGCFLWGPQGLRPEFASMASHPLGPRARFELNRSHLPQWPLLCLRSPRGPKVWGHRHTETRVLGPGDLGPVGSCSCAPRGRCFDTMHIQR